MISTGSLPSWIQLHTPVREALAAGRPVVALETALVTHGLPWPINLETARQAEAAVRSAGAVPATIAVLHGQLCVGLDDDRLEQLARETTVVKAARRDLAFVISTGASAGTTVSAAMFTAHAAGIRLLATGGIGGVHRGVEHTWDVSSDLFELGRTPVAVVCAGAKSILDIPRTLEVLETYSVPVIGIRTNYFPAFYAGLSEARLSARIDDAAQAARYLRQHWAMNGCGVVLAQALAQDLAVSSSELQDHMNKAEREAAGLRLSGSELTPFLLRRLAELTNQRTLTANRALVVANARLAAEISGQLGMP